MEIPVMNPLRIVLAHVAAGMFVLASPALLAHTDEYLDTLEAPNGGQLRMSGIYHFELVVAKDNKAARESPVVVYVTDHAGGKIPTVGAGGTATLVTGKRKVSVKFLPDGDNRLQGVARYASTPDLKVTVSITLADQTARQARFTPLAVAKGNNTEHKP
jgi:hypothetical protein